MIYLFLVSLCRSRTCLHSLPSSCDPAAMASGLVCVLFYHDHLTGNRWPGQLQSFLCLVKKCNAALLFFSCLTYLDTNLSLCYSPVCRSREHHDLVNRCVPSPDTKRIPQRALSDADLCALLYVWPVISVRGELSEAHLLLVKCNQFTV